ncbi:MAG: hypothetical protein ACTSVW_00450 [Candidatus Njordarchaeales archaeon]
MKPEGFVLWHVDSLLSFKAFDVFVRKGKIRKWKKEFEWLYQTDCLFAEVFQKLFKDYKYIGSEDDLHAFPRYYRFPKSFKVIRLIIVPPLDNEERAKALIEEELKKKVTIE